MKRRFHEVTCDRCGFTEQFPVHSRRVERQARQAGWKVNGKGEDQHHFCTHTCRKLWKLTESRKAASLDQD